MPSQLGKCIVIAIFWIVWVLSTLLCELFCCVCLKWTKLKRICTQTQNAHLNIAQSHKTLHWKWLKQKAKLIYLILLCCFSCRLRCVSNDSLLFIVCWNASLLYCHEPHCHIKITHECQPLKTNKNKYNTTNEITSNL